MLNFNDRLEIWWRHQKSHVILITILVFFWKILCSTTLMQNGLTDSGFINAFAPTQVI